MFPWTEAESALYQKLCGGAEAGDFRGKSSNLQHFSGSRHLVNDRNAKSKESHNASCRGGKEGLTMIYCMPTMIRPTILHFSSKAAEVCNHQLRHELAETLHLDLLMLLVWRSRNLVFWEVNQINAAIIGPSKLQVTRKMLLLPRDFDAAQWIQRISLQTDCTSFLFVYRFCLLGRLMTLMTWLSDAVAVVLPTLGESVRDSFTPSNHVNSCAKVLLWDRVHSWKCSNRPCGRWLL